MLISLETIAFMAGLATIGYALWLWNLGSKEKAELIRIPAIVLLLAAVLAQSCLIFHIAKYHFQGADERAYPTHEMCADMKGMMGMMQGDMMGGGMMGGDKKEGAKPMKADAKAGGEKNASGDAHEVHHLP